MYIGCGGTTAEMINSKNVIRLVDGVYEDGSYGKPISIGEDGFNFPNAGDAVSYIYGTSMLTDIGDLARVCKILRVQTMSFPKLRELNLGHEKTRTSVCGKPCPVGPYREYTTNYVMNDKGELVADGTVGVPQEFRNEILPNLDCSSLTQLTILDVTNHTNLSELVIDKCTQLQELYARGTIMKSLDLPATSSLRKVYLGSKLTSLNLTNLTGIEDLVIESLNDCGRLVISNCSDYVSKESYRIVQMAINKLESVYDPVTNPNVCTLRGIDWMNYSVDEELLKRLVNINANITGKIKLSSLSNELKVKLKNNPNYGNIDDVNNPLYIEYPRTYINKVNLSSKMYIFSEGTHPITFNVEPYNANTYEYAEWSLSSNSYAEINPSTGVITRNDIFADENTQPAILTLTVHQIPESDGFVREPIVKTSEVYFYERHARPGDIVFNDGSYSDELDLSKTPIGVCFYVDPENKNNRLMCALTALTNRYTWGAYPGSTFVSNNGASVQYYGSPLSLNVNGEQYKFDLSEIDNIKESGMPGIGNLGNEIYFTDDLFRDDTNRANNRFKEFSALSFYGDLGWVPAPERIKIDKLLLPNGNTSITVETNEMVPSGYYKTLAIIKNRNALLDTYENTQGQEGAFIRPAASGKITELENLNKLIERASSWSYEDRSFAEGGDTQAAYMYYTTASACFAYEPVGVTNLDDRFKKYNWFLPSSGELARLLYYVHQSYDGNALETPLRSRYDLTYKEDAANAFYNAISLNVLKAGTLSGSANFSSSTEIDEKSVCSIQCERGSYTASSKGSSVKVIPICRF